MFDDDTIQSWASADPADAPLSERQRLVLRLVVREYVATGRPVGSRTLVDHSGIGVSPATIRNEMAALEELGYLEHLHTSGGRVPTDKGYRYFVAHLMGDVELPSSEQLTILHQFRQVELQLEQWIELAAATLARAAGNVSVVSAPIPQAPRLRHVELVALQPRLGLLIIVTTDGAVRQVMVHWPEDADQETLSPLADNLSTSLRGLSPDDVAGRVQGASGLARAALEQVALALRGMSATGATPLRHSGLEHMLSQPEFSDAGGGAGFARPAGRRLVPERDAAAPGRGTRRSGLHRPGKSRRRVAAPRHRRFDLRRRRRGGRRPRCGGADAHGL